MNYINDGAYPWVVYIGVPYRTALWQVDDSSKQKGSYTMALGEYKEELIAKKEPYETPLTIPPHEIVPMVNYAWAHSFARYAKNKKAISDRGWNPLNCILLTDGVIMRSMTAQEKESEALPYHLPSPLSTVITPHTLTSTVIVPYSASTAIIPHSSTAIILSLIQSKSSIFQRARQHLYWIS